MKNLRRPEILFPFYFMTTSVIWIIVSQTFFLQFQSNFPSFQVNIQAVNGFVFAVAAAFFTYIGIRTLKKGLFQSQEEYKDLFYNAPDPMILYNINTKKFIEVNKAALVVYGYSASEFSEMTIDDLRVLNHTVDERNNIYKHQKKNKEIIICQETTRKITLKNVSACLLSAHNITELENAKAELTNQKNQLRLILNSITDGFFILDHQFVIKKANELFRKMAEVKVENVEGYKLFYLFPSLEKIYQYRKYSFDFKRNKSAHFEIFYEKTKSWFKVSAYPFEEDGFSVFFSDITREKEDKLQIHQNEQNLLALINNTEDLIWSIDCNFKYFTFNESFRKWYKLFFNEDVWNEKIAFQNGYKSEFDNRWRSMYERALNGEKFSAEMNFEINNTMLFTTVRFNPIYHANKKIFGVVCFLQNITESKLYEKKIEQQNSQLREIAFITSHKVRVPLANILGLADVLDEENPLCAFNIKVIEYIKNLQRNLT